jgi:hypothetical protein
MPVKRKTKKAKSRRGAGIATWAKNAHGLMRKHNAYSKGLSYAYNKYGKPMVARRLPKNSAIVDRGVKMALTKLKQAGYGLRRSGNGLRRSGSGTRLKY